MVQGSGIEVRESGFRVETQWRRRIPVNGEFYAARDWPGGPAGNPALCGAGNCGITQPYMMKKENDDMSGQPYLTGTASSCAEAHFEVIKENLQNGNVMAYEPAFIALVGITLGTFDPEENGVPYHDEITMNEWELIRNAVSIAFAAAIRCQHETDPESLASTPHALALAEQLVTAVKSAPRIHRQPVEMPENTYFLSKPVPDDDCPDGIYDSYLLDRDTEEWKIFNSIADCHKFCLESDVEEYRIHKAITSSKTELVYDNVEGGTK